MYPSHRPAAIDALESRRLLSVSFSGGVIKIITTDKKDVIIAQNVDASHFRLNVNGDVRVYTTRTVSLLDVRTKDGADRVDFTGIKIRAKVDGGRGGDTLLGGRRADTLFGSGGSDRIFGNEDADELEGGLYSDTLDGGAGDDRLIPFSDPTYDDSIFGGEGVDTVDYSAETKDLSLDIRDDGDEPNGVVTDEIAGDVEIVLCGSGDDVVTNRLGIGLMIDGGDGDDSLIGSDGEDFLLGGAGMDTLIGAGGDDRFKLGGRDAVADVVDGGAGNDSFVRTSVDSMDSITNVP